MALRCLPTTVLVTLALAGTVLARPPARPRGVPLDVSADLTTTALAVVDGQLVFADSGKRITAVSLARGQVSWVRELSGWAVGGVAGAGGLVLVVTTDQRVQALDSRTGAPRWQTALPARPERIVQVDGSDVLVTTAVGRIGFQGERCVIDGIGAPSSSHAYRPSAASTPTSPPSASAYRNASIARR